MEEQELTQLVDLLQKYLNQIDLDYKKEALTIMEARNIVLDDIAWRKDNEFIGEENGR